MTAPPKLPTSEMVFGREKAFSRSNTRCKDSFGERTLREQIRELHKDQQFRTISQAAGELGIPVKRLSSAYSNLLRDRRLKATEMISRSLPPRTGKKHGHQRVRFYVSVGFLGSEAEIEYLDYDKALGKSVVVKRRVLVGFYEELHIAKRTKPEQVYSILDSSDKALFRGDIMELTELSKKEVTSAIRSLLVRKSKNIQQSRPVENDSAWITSKGFLYYIRKEQLDKRLREEDMNSLFVENTWVQRITEEIEHHCKATGQLLSFFELHRRTEMEPKELKSALKRIKKMSNKRINSVQIRGECYYCRSDHLSGFALEREKKRIIRETRQAFVDSNKRYGGLVYSDSRSTHEERACNAPQASFGQEMRKDIWKHVIGSRAWYSALLYAMNVGLAWNKYRMAKGLVGKGEAPATPAGVFRRFDSRAINEKLQICFNSKTRRNPASAFVLLHLFEGLTDRRMRDGGKTPSDYRMGLLAYLQRDKEWQKILGIREIPSPSRVSDFKRIIGEEKFHQCLKTLAEQVLQMLNIEEIEETFLQDYLCHYLSHQQELRKAYFKEQHTGRNLHINLSYALGVVSLIQSCTLREKRDNTPYSIENFVYTFLSMPLIDIKNNYKMGTRLKEGCLDEAFNVKTPCADTLARNLALLDYKELEQLSYRLAKRFRRIGRKSRGRIAVDATKLIVYGDYPDSVLAYIPDTNSVEKVIYILLAYDIDTHQPVCFRLLTKEYQTEGAKTLKPTASLLLDIINDAEKALGRKIHTVLFDREFKSYAVFTELTKRGINFVTPTKDEENASKAINDISQGQFKEAQIVKSGNKKEKIQVAEVPFRHKDYLEYSETDVLRIVAKLVTDTEEDNEIRHSFITNIGGPPPEKIIELYSKRWRIENHFKELKGDWHLKDFPSTTTNAVRAHLCFKIICYTITEQYKTLFLKGKGRNLKTLVERELRQDAELIVENGEIHIQFHWTMASQDPHRFLEKQLAKLGFI